MTTSFRHIRGDAGLDAGLRGGVVAIGDGMLTDVKGAADNGVDVLYVSGGVHARDYGHPDEPEPEKLQAFLDKHGFSLVATMPKLR